MTSHITTFLKALEILIITNFLLAVGSGCFKCGAVDHIAKDCTGSPTKQPKPPTYILKDNNTQHGGDNSRSVTLHAALKVSLRVSLCDSKMSVVDMNWFLTKTPLEVQNKKRDAKTMGPRIEVRKRK